MSLAGLGEAVRRGFEEIARRILEREMEARKTSPREGLWHLRKIS